MQLTDAHIGLAMAGGFVLLWLSVCTLSAKFGGWRKLHSKYATLGMPTGKMYRFCSARLGKTSYNNALNIHVSSRGLYLVPIIFFRFSHPPIVIPWREIHVEEEKGLFGTITYLSVGKPKILTLRLGSGFVERSKIKQYLSTDSKSRFT